MYAIIQTGGKQYKVKPGDELKVEKLDGNPGDTVKFQVLMIEKDDGDIKVGTPYLDDVLVRGRILSHGKHKKIIVFKYKRRKNYKRKKGHRQPFNLVKIEEIKEESHGT